MAIWKQILIICILAVASYGGLEAWNIHFNAPVNTADGKRKSRAVIVETDFATIETLEKTIEATGTTRAIQSVDIVPESNGRIIEMAITAGSHVEAGAILVRMDSVVEEAYLTEAMAKVEEQTKALDRIKRLRQTNSIAEVKFDETVARLAEADAQLDRAKKGLAERTIEAPFAGIIGLPETNAGSRVSAGDVIARLDDLSAVEIEFSLPETLYSSITRGQSIFAQSTAFNDATFEGHIDSIDSRIDPLSRSFRVRAILPNPNRLLPAGMFMSLQVILSREPALMIPEEAIVFQAAKSYVFLIKGKKAVRIPIATGERQAGRITVLDGLKAGDEIVLKGLQRLRDGSDVIVHSNQASGGGDTS